MIKKIFLALLMILLLAGGVSAFSTLSLDKIDFLSNDPTINKPAFVLLAVDNGGSQYATYSLSNLGQALPNDYKLVGDGTISSEIKDYRIEYPVTIKEGVFTLQEVGQKFSLTTPNDWCESLTGIYGYRLKKDAGLTNWRCFDIVVYGYYGDILEGQHKFIDEVTVNTNKGSEKIVLTESDVVGSTKIGPNNHVVAKVQGAITNFQDVPRPDLERDAFYDSKTNTWYPINKLTSNEFDSLYSISALYAYLEGGCGSVDECVSGWQQRLINAFSRKDYSNARITGTSTSNGVLVLTPNTIYKYPLFTLTIDADWVGIVRLVGKPMIISVNAPKKVIEGTNNLLSVTVKNDAEVDASFVFSWDCDGPLSVSNVGTQKFDGFETRTINFNVYGQTSTGCSGASCVLTVKDFENPSSSDDSSVSLQVCEANQCDYEGGQRCLGNTIQECRNENGVLVWHNIKNCLYGCELDNGFGVCKQESNNVVPVCGDEVCVERERDPSDNYYCPSDCSSPDPVCGDGVCDFRERPGQPFECLQPEGDCPVSNGSGSSGFVISLLVGGALVAGAVVYRLRKEGYI